MNNGDFENEFWGEYSDIGIKKYYNDKEKNIEFEKKNEEKIRNILSRGHRKIKVLRYSCYDENGNETAQTIKTKFGIVRCPDIYFERDDFFEEMILRVEVKHHRRFFKIDEDKFVRIEAQISDDYLRLQSDEEDACRVMFLIYEDSGKIYWQRISQMNSSKKEVFDDTRKIYFYYWDFRYLRVYEETDFFRDIY